MTKFIVILLSAVFVNNYVLSRFLGICPFLGVSKKLDSATGMSLAVIFVMLMATAATTRRSIIKRIIKAFITFVVLEVDFLSIPGF